MTVASAQTLRELKPVQPFVERTTRDDGFTYGLGPAGYDVRIAEDLALEPGAFTLVSTIERFSMPNFLLGVVHDKSTWARMGLAVQNTVIEPGWRGHLTLELTNHCIDRPELIITKGMPIAQVIFHLLDHPTNQPYYGKYQDQPSGPQAAKIW